MFFRYIFIPLLCFSAILPLGGTSFASLSDDDKITLDHVASIFNGMQTIASRFSQQSANSLPTTGWFVISKPGKARISYDSLPLILIASGGVFMSYDTKTGEKAQVPMGSSPFRLLLDSSLSFDNPRITVLRLERYGKNLAVTVHDSQNPALGELTLLFERDTLTGWHIVDATGLSTTTTLLPPLLINRSVSSKLFRLHTITPATARDIFGVP